jgi:Mg-chelatase subunit ChlI
MQEYQVTVGGVRYPLDRPLFVLATENPIEQEGTHPLPEAQLDRFMFNVVIGYPDAEDERRILVETTRRISRKSSPWRAAPISRARARWFATCRRPPTSSIWRCGSHERRGQTMPVRRSRCVNGSSGVRDRAPAVTARRRQGRSVA